MSNAIRVVQFGGQQDGSITQEQNGFLTVRGATSELERALRDLIAQITAVPLTYVSGREVQTVHDLRHLTVQKTVVPGDPEYLAALADALPRYRLLGKRVRGVLG